VWITSQYISKKVKTMKNHLAVVLSAGCILLLFGVIALQFKHQSQDDTLKEQHETLRSAFDRQQKEQLDSATELAKQVTTVGLSLESRIAQCEERVNAVGAEVAKQVTTVPQLNAKSDEIISQFSKHFSERAAEAVAQLERQIGIQLERVAGERTAKSEQLLKAASVYEVTRPELAELCYVSAFNGSGGTADLSLKKFLDWKQRVFENMSDIEILEESPARLMSLYQALDKGLPDSMVSPKEMEDALLRVDRIANGVSMRQQAKVEEFKKGLSWSEFVSTNLESYETMKESLDRFSPINETLENERLELLQLAANFTLTATALQSDLLDGLLPPSPRASPGALGEWLKRGIDQVTTPTNPLDARITGLSVLMDFAKNQTEVPELSSYIEAIRIESENLACEDWCGHVDDFCEIAEKESEPNAELMAVGQSLLTQGFGILKSFTTKSRTSGVSAKLPGLAIRLCLQREILLDDQVKLAGGPDAFSSREQRARARSLLYGQVLSTLFDVRNVEAKIVKECSPAPEELVTLNLIKTNLGEYLTGYDKYDQADQIDVKSEYLKETGLRNTRYRNSCSSHIQSAKQYYAGAEEIAAEYFTNWGHETVQSKLRRGLQALYSLDTNDLNRADPGLYNEWCRVEEMLKKQFVGNPSEVNASTTKQSLADF